MIKKILLPFFIIMILSACANNLDSLKNSDKSKADPYHAALAKNYQELLDNRSSQLTFADRNLFMQKGLRALNGGDISPEAPEKWHIQNSHIHELTWAYKNLSNMVTDEVKRIMPKDSAHLQTLYECWLANQQDAPSSENLKLCRMDYVMESSSLEQKYVALTRPIESDTSSVNKIKTLEPAPVVLASGKSYNYTIYFGFNKSNPKNDAKKIIKNVVGLTSQLNKYNVNLSGHTDRTGPIKYNLKLSKRRTDKIAKELVKDGVNKNAITKEYYGEAMPAVLTKHGVANWKNRRVEVKVTNTDKDISTTNTSKN